MPQLNLAPTPGAALAVTAPAKASPGTPVAADAAPEGQVQPFAAVLKQQQVNQQQTQQQQQADRQPASAPASPAGELSPPAGKVLPVDPTGELVVALDESSDPALSEPKGAVADQPPADAIAAIAQMLPGIAPAQPVQEVAAPKAAGTQTEDDTGTAPLLAASSVPQAAMTPVAVKPVSEAAEGRLPSVFEDVVAEKAANVAAEISQPAAGQAASAGEGTDFSALLASAATQQAATGQRDIHAARAVPNHLPVSTPVGAPGWDKEVGAKLTWMAGRQEGHAELVLNPPQLGRIEVSLSVNGDQASAMFSSPHQAVREALENALPRLREVLSEAGIALGQAQVGAESFRQSSGSGEKGDNPGREGSGRPADDALGSGHAAPGLLRRINGLVDTFA